MITELGTTAAVFPGDERKIEGVRRAVASGETRLLASTGSDGEVPLDARLLPR
jgi:hypothetical protein